MQTAKAMLYCPNLNCQTLNSETHKFCQTCRTPLPRRYLWAIGNDATAFRPGDLLVDRYLCKADRIFLDTKPGLSPTISVGIPDQLAAYLRLSPYQLHLPQLYDLIRRDDGSPYGSETVLLEQSAVCVPTDLAARGIQVALDGSPQGGSALHQTASSNNVQLLPAITSAWQASAALRQLNWLWQIAQLWQPFSSERVASSLLTPELLRVEGGVVRLLELRSDPAGKAAPTLAALGQLWLQWSSTANPEIAPLLQRLSQQLIQGQLKNAELLLDRLDEGLAMIGRSQTRYVQVATRTDRGPSRQRNEDACYPPDGTVQTRTIGQPQSDPAPALVIVCDGIGGHQGGDVASSLAIEAIGRRVQPLRPETLDPISFSVELEKAVCDANDLISQRNDSEQRLDRQRMGTTLVMGMVRTHECFITHVGDSRAYWITRWGCRQVTQDDDVASREVRLGYSSYRQALQQPSAGSLVQALGMGTSKALHPTVQRFVLDEDGIFLLCSDGLSDNDRVEECWETDILPLLDGKTDLATVNQRLVDIANTRNGYDNVTVGLLYYQVHTSQQPSTGSTVPVNTQLGTNVPTVIQTSETASGAPALAASAADSTSTMKTQIVAPRSSKSSPLPLLLGILLLLGLGGLLVYFLIPSVSRQVDTLLGLNPTPVPEAEPTIAPSPTPISPTVQSINAGDFVQLRRSVPADTLGSTELVLLTQPKQDQSTAGASGLTSAVAGRLPIGSILKVERQQGATQTSSWVQLRVCSVPARVVPSASPSPTRPSPAPSRGQNVPASPVPSPGSEANLPAPLLQPGQTGWIRSSDILPLISSIASPSSAQRGVCVPLSSPPVSNPGTPNLPPASPASP